MGRLVMGLLMSFAVALAAIGCMSSAPGASVAASLPPQAATHAEFGVAYCAAFDAMFTAIGNPDTGHDSDLSEALERAVTARDVATANRLAATIVGHLERGRQAAWIARGWPSADPAMVQLDRVLVAYEAMVEAKRVAAAGTGAVDPQVAFENAGGVQAWFAMMEAGRRIERPPGTSSTTCPTVPVSF